MSIVYLPDLQPLFHPLNQWVEGSSPSENTKDIRKGVFFCVPPAGRAPSIGPQKHFSKFKILISHSLERLLLISPLGRTIIRKANFQNS